MGSNAMPKILAYNKYNITENDTSQVIAGLLTQKKKERKKEGILIKTSDGLDRRAAGEG